MKKIWQSEKMQILFNVLNEILVYIFIVKIHWTSTENKTFFFSPKGS